MKELFVYCRTSAFKPWQTDLCGLLVGGGKAIGAPGTSAGVPRAIPASPTHASKSTHKLIGAGHSNSLDSAEDALSCASSASGNFLPSISSFLLRGAAS